MLRNSKIVITLPGVDNSKIKYIHPLFTELFQTFTKGGPVDPKFILSYFNT